MSIEDPEKIKSFWDQYPYSILYLKIICGLTHFEFQPRADSPLYPATSREPHKYTVRLRWDTAIAPSTLANHHWQVEELIFVRNVTDRYPAVTVVDIGANIGLFSRQVLSHCPTVTRSYSYEPEPENFGCLLHNMKPFPAAHLEMSAIGDSVGTAQFHLDLRNCGNNSLVSNDLGGAYETITVEVSVLAAEAESQRWLSHEQPIFYKSDTQGYDEKIICLLPLSFWDNVVGGLIEVAHMAKPDFDREKFIAFLNRYENKVDVKNPTVNLTTQDILAYLDSKEDSDSIRGIVRNMDVGFWR